MKLKSVILASAAAVLGLSMGSAFAVNGLQLCASNYPNEIKVKCGPNMSSLKDGLPIPVNGCAGGTTLPWFVIKGMFGSSAVDCVFIDSKDTTNTPLVTAHLVISGNLAQGTVTHGDPTVPGVSVEGGPFGSAQNNVTATVVKK